MSDSARLAKLLEDFTMDGLELEPEDIVTDIVALIRVQKLDDTDDALIICSSTNTGGIVCHGILTVGVLQHTQWMTIGDDTE